MNNNVSLPVKVTKEITFDCAHMLHNYDGLCANLHGHTYKMQITLIGSVETETGMLLDFNQLKRLLQDNVMTNFDHAMIFNNNPTGAEKEIYDVCVKNHLRFFMMPKEFPTTTAESLSSFFQHRFVKVLVSKYSNVSAVSVKLWETPTSFAEAGTCK